MEHVQCVCVLYRQSRTCTYECRAAMSLSQTSGSAGEKGYAGLSLHKGL